VGTRQRYRLIDLEQLCWRLGTASLEEVRGNLEACLAETIARDQMKREPCWTESLAVGGVCFLEKVNHRFCPAETPRLLKRARTFGLYRRARSLTDKKRAKKTALRP
jgi:hypothetical protein